MTFYHLSLFLKKGKSKRRRVPERWRRGEGSIIASVLEALIVGLAGLHALIWMKSVIVLLHTSKEACLALFGMWLWGS